MNFSSLVTTAQRSSRSSIKRLSESIRVLGLIASSSKKNGAKNRQTHLRLIEDILQADSFQFIQQKNRSSDLIRSRFENDPIAMLFCLQREQVRADPIVISHALASCWNGNAVYIGFQIHCLSIRHGLLGNVYVGSALITLYCKYGDLFNAYKVFDEMPVRNVVSWTAIITGFAQDGQVDVCWDIYRQMRKNSMEKPNDFTLTSLLNVCTNSGILGQGKIAHCQAILMGFDSYIHISNALISMYSKCGDFKEAIQVFDKMLMKDLVSWNSMIAGYAQHGLALNAIKLFEDMKKERVKPDAITFLGILCSCRHSGLVEQGQLFFNSMGNFSLDPGIDHYACIVDLLGRAGKVEEALDFIKKMSIEPNAVVWGSLLSSSRLHGNVWIGIEAAESRLILEPDCAATHLQLVNLYAGVGYWDQAARVRKLMKHKGLKTDPGYSSVEINNNVYRYGTSSADGEIYELLNGLIDNMREPNQEQVMVMNETDGHF
ncbi:pentatricopeptide repeat-containing protein At2g37320 [Impatiens glandulifera]|uniref:pentatricopeptide repeat-containing protein At2g37320 n=1 Tax=Impatiens glandulifera TaxID=253017 RepID=UPI001FB07EE3|nr:pentatricopeptide repeat-containing protein At2g37320 [Impatiens glandulifera]